MKRGGRGVVCFSCWFSWVCWDGLFIRRSRLLPVQDGFLDKDLVGSGEVDGVAEDLVVVTLMIPRLLILERIRASDMVMGQLMVGDLGSGVELLEVLLLGIWLEIEVTDKSQPHREATLGSVATRVAVLVLLDALRAPALLLDMRAQDLDQRQGDNVVIRGIF